MSVLAIAAAALFVIGYILIVLEQRLGMHKASLALALGAGLWLVTSFALPRERAQEALERASVDIFGVVVFLIAAMALVEVLAHYRLFDVLQSWLLRRRIGSRGRALAIFALTFVLSALLDNIIVTIVMLQVARRLSVRQNMIIMAAGIVVAANAGGAWSPIGDITSVLLWLAGKITAGQLLTNAFLPTFTLMVIVTAMLLPRLSVEDFLEPESNSVDCCRSEWLIIGIALASFLLPLAMNALGLPPFLGLLLGLGVTWIVISLMKRSPRQQTETHLQADIEKLIQSIDLASVTYLMGILLSVNALAALGILQTAYRVTVGDHASFAQFVGMNAVLGLVSSIIDNSSLVTMAIKVVDTIDPRLWALTALTTGNGGSLMLIGSAAGIVAAGSVKELTFKQYAHAVTLPVCIGYVAAIGVWLLQGLLA